MFSFFVLSSLLLFIFPAFVSAYFSVLSSPPSADNILEQCSSVKLTWSEQPRIHLWAVPNHTLSLDQPVIILHDFGLVNDNVLSWTVDLPIGQNVSFVYAQQSDVTDVRRADRVWTVIRGDRMDCLPTSSSPPSSPNFSMSEPPSFSSSAVSAYTTSPSAPLLVQLSARDDDSSSSSSGSSVPVGVIVPVVLFGVLLIIIVVGYWVRRSHQKQSDDYPGHHVGQLDVEGFQGGMTPARMESGHGSANIALRTVRSFTSILNLNPRSRTNTISRSRANTLSGHSPAETEFKPPPVPLMPYNLNMASGPSSEHDHDADQAQRAASPSYTRHRLDAVLPPDATYVSVTPAALRRLSTDGQRLSLDGRTLSVEGGWKHMSGGIASVSGSSGSGSRLLGVEAEEPRGVRTPDTLPPAYRDYMDPPVESPVEHPEVGSATSEPVPEPGSTPAPAPAPAPASSPASSPTAAREAAVTEHPEERRD